jgi:hypothetical protein
MPFIPLHSVAFDALDHAYNVGYFVCGAAAAVWFVLAAVMLGGRRRASEPVSEEVTERREPEPALP